MINADFLLKLKREIEEAKIKKAQLEGKLQTFKEQLKEHNIDSIQQAENILVSLNQETKIYEEKFNNEISDIEEALNGPAI